MAHNDPAPRGGHGTPDSHGGRAHCFARQCASRPAAAVRQGDSNASRLGLEGLGFAKCVPQVWRTHFLFDRPILACLAFLRIIG